MRYGIWDTIRCRIIIVVNSLKEAQKMIRGRERYLKIVEVIE